LSQRLVITGGAGFIGSNLAGALAEENNIVVVDDLSTGKRENLAGIIARLVQGT
jgi:UDP-glucose 4-epimerase